MAIGVSTWVWDHSKSRHGARLVLLAIADYMSAGHSWAWPSVPELSRKTQLKERAVQTAIGDLVKLGELEVGYNAGPKGCNRYRVLMHTPAENAPPQDLHPADSAPPQKMRGPESSQEEGQTPAENAPPAENAGVQISTQTPAENAPGTVREPKTFNSPTESPSPRNVPLALVPDSELGLGANGGKPKRGRPPKPADDPLFAEWYQAYPVHKDRGAAEKAWAAAVREGADPQVLIAAAKRYRTDPQVGRGYAKYPATWLNAKCWLDESTGIDRAQQQRDSERPPVGRQINYTDEEYRSGWH